MKSNRIWSFALTGWLGSASLFACGPDFPNTLLDGGDGAVLTAPVADFYRELQRMKLPLPAFQALPATDGPGVQSIEADLADLNVALRKANTPAQEREGILQQHRAEREKLRQYQEALDDWRGRQQWASDADNVKDRRPVLGDVLATEGLPGEFADYFRGLIAYHRGNNLEARRAWETLLDRPKEQRHFRSAWAAYMLGRLCGDAEPEKAIEHFRQTRQLVKQGFADRLGLAAASLGWEARANLRLNRFEAAIELYLQQLASGDETAARSLRHVASSVLESDADVLRSLAANPRTRHAVTACVISRRWAHSGSGAVMLWLEAVEAAGVRDVESAEQLALAAYQAGEMEIAQRWISRSHDTPVAQWLQAKLLLRAGKVDQAARLLAKVSNLFPIESEGARTGTNGELKDSLYAAMYAYSGTGEIDAAHRVLGELGVLRLARREYTEALDALLRSGFWTDAAYVAERVLNPAELKSYVDRNWPGGQSDDGKAAVAAEHEERSDNPFSSAHIHTEIRYLLARRLVRLSRCHEAREYFPAMWQAKFDELVKSLSSGENENLPAERRAAGFFEAAKIVRHDGMELMGTEVQPDWHLYGGNFDLGSIGARRATNETANALFASKDEVHRTDRHRADPEARFHYRYQAAFLALDAARLLPDNADETARILCTAGSWLKERDPQTADLFYKALVRRCRKTAIGAEADRKRWFPKLDENGNLVPSVRPSQTTELTPNQPSDEASQPVKGTPAEEPANQN